MVQAAIRIADEDGVDAVTMRQLGERVGVKAMALYRYVSGREALLDAMVAELMHQLSGVMKPHVLTPTTGSAYLRLTAHDVRNLALAHPWLVRLMVLRPPPDPRLRRPLVSQATTEAFLEGLHRRGFDTTSSVRLYRAFCAFLLAQLLIEVPAPTAEPRPRLSTGRGPPPQDRRIPHPLLINHLQLLTIQDQRAEFEAGLSLLVDSAAQLRAEP